MQRKVPGIDFHRLRAQITIEQVLDVVQFTPTRRRGDQWYGHCPLHDHASHGRSSFSVNVATRRYTCHRCKSHGNSLELWAAFIKQPLYPATIELCQRLGIQVPWITHW
jgi:DNA primase